MSSTDTPHQAHERSDTLTAKQCEVLVLYERGMSHYAIAAAV